MLLLVATLLLFSGGCGPKKSDDDQIDAPVVQLFADHGWGTSDPVVRSKDRLPQDFRLRTGTYPWRVFLDLSIDIGLDFSSLAGTEVETIRFTINDLQGGRLQGERSKYTLQGVALVGPDGVPVGAWITYTNESGEIPSGTMGFSLKARSLDEITGLTWQEYVQKHR